MPTQTHSATPQIASPTRIQGDRRAVMIERPPPLLVCL